MASKRKHRTKLEISCYLCSRVISSWDLRDIAGMARLVCRSGCPK